MKGNDGQNNRLIRLYSLEAAEFRKFEETFKRV
jgi:hypothetical protein